MKAINIPVGNIWHLISHLCRCEELGINFKKAFSLLGDKSFRTNPLVGSREQLENPVTLPEIVESTSGQAEVERPKRGRKGCFLPGPSAGKRTAITQKVQRGSSSRTQLFLPPDSSNYHNQAVDSNYAFLSLQPRGWTQPQQQRESSQPCRLCIS